MRTIPSITVSIAIIALSIVFLSMNFVQAQDKSNDEFDNLKPIVLEPIDREQLIKEAEEQEKNAEKPMPFRFAVVEDNLSFTTANSGMWEDTADGRRWRLRLKAPGALSLSLGITRFNLPEGAALQIYDVDRKLSQGPYTATNRSENGQLWTAIIQRDEIIVEILVSADAEDDIKIEITHVNKGFRGFGSNGSSPVGMDMHDSCHVNVKCDENDGGEWQNEIKSVTAYTLNGTHLCTGTMVNNTSLDKTPYVISAAHCVDLDPKPDPSQIHFYWNYQSASCETHGGGILSHPQMGATIVAESDHTSILDPNGSDFLLFKLNQKPNDITLPGGSTHGVYYSGWDANNLMLPLPTLSMETVGIHHPMGNEKEISKNSNSITSTRRGFDMINPTDNYWRVDDWEIGSTEFGSSGSCLWYTHVDPVTGPSKHCIGISSVGLNDPVDCHEKADWYGKFSTSWDLETTNPPTSNPFERVHDLLDPDGNGDPIRLNGDPHITTTKYDKVKQIIESVKFDFQAKGEFVAFRDTDIAEIQVRMSPISTTFQPDPNPYHGLASCVSINSAVAAQVGKHRITYQPNLDGDPDPEGLQLRIDGELANLDDDEFDLGNGGKVVRTDDNGGILVDFPEKYSLIVTPNWWASQKAWYLNIGIKRKPVLSVSGQSANSSPGLSIGGLAAPIAPDSWLSLLSDGSSVGAMPASLADRYSVLYEKFGESWRVTDATSLFDYAPGTSTDTFTMKSWPGFNGDCKIQGVTPIEGLSDPDVAKEVCGQLEDKEAQADCVFDVMVTGETGFAETYLRSEQALQTLP